jgi:hypothetical protein
MHRRSFIVKGTLAAAACALALKKNPVIFSRIGKIRMSGDDLAAAGVLKGDLVLVDLFGEPVAGQLCAASIHEGNKLVVGFYHPQDDFEDTERGAVRLTRDAEGKTGRAYGFADVMIFGPVLRVEKGAAHPHG